MSVYDQPQTVAVPAELIDPVASGEKTTVTTVRRFSIGQLLSGIVGSILTVFGVVALVRTGIDGTFDRPVVDVVGLAHSSIIGLVELGVGVLILLGAVARDMRALGGFMGLLLFIFGVVVVAASDEILLKLGTERTTGWFLMIMGAAAAATAALPTTTRTTHRVSTGQTSVS